MVYVGLDLSVNSTGVCIANSEINEILFVRLTSRAYDKDMSKGDRMLKSIKNAGNIAKAICKLLLAYRQQQIKVAIESISFGLMHSHTSSVTDLMFEGGIVAHELMQCFNAEVTFVQPKKHKKSFTGHGNANKALSISKMLNVFPQLGWTSDKLDDMADALSVMSVILPNYMTYEPKVICI